MTPLSLKIDLITKLMLLAYWLHTIQTYKHDLLAFQWATIFGPCGVKIKMIFFLLLGAFGHWSSGPYIIDDATALTKEILNGPLV